MPHMQTLESGAMSAQGSLKPVINILAFTPLGFQFAN